MSQFSFFSLKTQFENVGDALINREMINLASEHSDIYLDLTRCPKDFCDTLNVCNENEINIIRFGFAHLFIMMLSKRLKGHECYYFLSPGGYFGEVYGGEHIKRWINTLVLFILSLFGIKICHVGVSYERLGKKFSRLIRVRNKFIHAHVVRDKKSRDYLQCLDIHVTDVSPDLAFNIFNDDLVTDTRNDFCFSYRTDQDHEQLELAKTIINQFDLTADENATFYFYVQVERDREGMKSLYEYFSRKSSRNCKYIEVIGSIDESLMFFNKISYVISNRLHVLLMSGSQHCYLISNTYKDFNNKIVGIIEQLSGKPTDLYDMSKNSLELAQDAISRRYLIHRVGLSEKELLKECFASLYRLTK
ncbi:MAG: polysaccharide pyruvyl transferase family protein [Moritella sp.]|uniref:polysaccharide pyruvyl transferase family protein n=1 Tax=Moritella sp. PE36 TaxID=58051 RepID=UPI000156817C|nr:polysaccharide pyruvyl transferase family protein [Moritella sp. PE36]EDM67456.1 hypothetical protein PE36_00484 [Moritella sp. PE36]PHR88111.1 MAG: polysaccharide pyruvyl transferase family protein [Moritella sp.]